MIKIINVSASLDVGGAETLQVNILENINKEKYKIDFLCYGKKQYAYEDRIKQSGSKIYKINEPTKIGMLNHIKELYIFFKKNDYQVVHCHNLFNCGPVLFAAWLAKVKIRISHSHTTNYLNINKESYKKKIYYFLARKMINIFATTRLACSEQAGKFLYKNKKFIIIKNGINVNKFKYNSEMRNMLRKELNINNDIFVIGHVGRLSYPKNQEFLIDIFYQYHLNNKKSVLVLLGDGKDKYKLVQKVEKLGIKSNVYFLGCKENIYDYYNIMDYFIFPSIHEGLPYTLIEAQCNGLTCLVSDSVSLDSKLTKNYKFISLNSNISNWVNEIPIKFLKRKNNIHNIVNNGYDILDTVEKIEKIYSRI